MIFPPLPVKINIWYDYSSNLIYFGNNLIERIRARAKERPLPFGVNEYRATVRKTITRKKIVKQGSWWSGLILPAGKNNKPSLCFHVRNTWDFFQNRCKDQIIEASNFNAIFIPVPRTMIATRYLIIPSNDNRSGKNWIILPAVCNGPDHSERIFENGLIKITSRVSPDYLGDIFTQ